MKKIIIAIDGYASGGKSTLAKALAKELGYLYIDTGAMYRAVTLFFIENGISLNDPKAIAWALEMIRIRFYLVDEKTRTLLNGRDVEDEIREMAVSEIVSEVASIPSVRRAMVLQQQAMGKERGCILDGRDIGTVVFPDAELKIFLTADANERAWRRFKEYKAKGLDITLDEVRENLIHRDLIDSTREDSPLRKADEAIILDTTHLTPEDQFHIALDLAKAKIGR